MSAATSDDDRSGDGPCPQIPGRASEAAPPAMPPDRPPYAAAPPGVPLPEPAAPAPLPGPGAPDDAAPRGRAPLVSLLTALVITALGVPLGLLWWGVAPGVPLVKTEDGGALTEPQPEQFAAADGWFSLLGLGFGVLVAVLAWTLLRRFRGPVGLLGVVLGGIGAGLSAWGVSRWLSAGELRRRLDAAAIGEVLQRPPEVRAGRFEWVHGVLPTIQGNLLLPAFGAAVAYTLLAGWSRYASLGVEPGPERPEDVDGPLSSDSPARPAPPAAPAPPAPGAATPPPD